MKKLKQIVTFIPLKNPITDIVTATLSFRSSDGFIVKVSKTSKIIFLILVIIIGVLLLLLYKELKYKMNLEREVENRTKERFLLKKHG